MTLELLLEALAKATLILAVALLFTSVARKLSAAVSHAYLVLALASVLIVPVASRMVPGLHMPAKVPVQAPVVVAPLALEAVQVHATAPSPAPLQWSKAVALAWAAGLLFALARLALALGSIWRITRRARPIELPFALDCPVRASDQITVPLTWGLFRPVILVPAAALQWPVARLRSACTHERAHIERRDWLTQMLGAIATAVYWFHPLAWIAVARMVESAERACDDRVLAAGVPAADYASHLVEIAKSVRAQPTLALCVVGARSLEARVRGLLEPDRKRNAPGRWFAALAVALGLAVLLPISAVHLFAQAGPGKLTGTVYDPSGAVIPSAMVGAKNLDGSNQEASRCDAAGHFEFNGLPLGRYVVTVQTPGFKAYHSEPVQVSATGANLKAVLDVGGVFEQVDVLGRGPAPALNNPNPQRIRVGGNVQATRLITRIQPVYPEHAQVAGTQGTVVMNAVIGIDGVPRSLTVISKSADPELASAATDAVSQWRYQPTLLNGAPIEVVTTIAVTFRLAP